MAVPGMMEKIFSSVRAKFRGVATYLWPQSSNNQAIGALEKGKEESFEDITSLREKYEACRVQGKWDEAKSAVEKMIEIEPDNPNHYFLLGMCYRYLSKRKVAEPYYRKALEMKHDMAIDDLVSMIKVKSNLKDSTHSRFVMISGRMNYGAIEHEDKSVFQNKKYLTKITNKEQGYREILFYTELYNKYPELQNIAPECLSVIELNNICYITMEKICGDKPGKEDLPAIIKMICSTLSAINYRTYSDLDEVVCVTEQDIDLDAPIPSKNTNYLIKFFKNIHKKINNEKLLYFFEKKACNNSFQLDLIKGLKQIILNDRLYEKVNPEVDYAFLHGDLTPKNILIDQNDHRPVFFDWDKYTVGPAWLDLAHLLVRSKLNFSEVDEVYLSDDDTGGRLQNIDKIFFVYALILMWLQRFDQHSFWAEENCYRPAFQYLNSLLPWRASNSSL